MEDRYVEPKVSSYIILPNYISGMTIAIDGDGDGD